MDFLAANWGALLSGLGVLVSLVGIGWAIKEARGARSASKAAQLAARATRDDIRRYLQTVDLVRAIGLIQRVKLLHDAGRWKSAMEQYQDLRRMLSDIITRCPESQAELRDKLADGRIFVNSMENRVDERDVQPIEAPERAELNQQLNEIQIALEELSSAIGFGDAPREAT